MPTARRRHLILLAVFVFLSERSRLAQVLPALLPPAAAAACSQSAAPPPALLMLLAQLPRLLSALVSDPPAENRFAALPSSWVIPFATLA